MYVLVIAHRWACEGGEVDQTRLCKTSDGKFILFSESEREW